MDSITIACVTMSIAAARNVEETGTDVAADLARLRSGEVSAYALLDECLDGVDADRVDGWTQYVDALADAAFPERVERGQPHGTDENPL